MAELKNVYFHTFGCKVNQYETESLREKLASLGYKTTQDITNSDLCIINSCSVTSEADRKCRQFVRKALRQNEKARIVVTGCYATRDPNEIKKISPRIELFSNQEKETIPEALSGCSLLTSHSSLLTLFNGHTRAFVKVQDGCDATCTYCIIPKVRSKMESRAIDEIKHEVHGLLDQGYKEIVLTGIRLGSYGLSSSGGRVSKIHGNLAALLKELLSLDHIFRIRLSSLEITEVTKELLELAQKEEKICRHFHLPLQSGDDFILKRMGRWYNSQFFSEKILEIKNHLPDVGLTTDVIVGFPGEKEENFQNTYSFIEKHFNGLHVFPFSDRPGTSALKLKEHNSPLRIQERVAKLLELDKKLRKEFQNRFAGQSRMVLAESDGGFTDNGIRILPPLPIKNGELKLLPIPN